MHGPPYTPYTEYDGVTLPIISKCMYRKSSRNITCNTALNGQGNLLFKADYRQEISRKCNTALNDLKLSKRLKAVKTDKIISYSNSGCSKLLSVAYRS